MKEPVRCYLYTCISTSVPSNGSSMEEQQVRLRKYAHDNALQIVGEYTDTVCSGKSIQSRPNLQRMLDDIEAQKDAVAVVLVFHPSGLAGNSEDIRCFLQWMKDHGVDLICAEEEIGIVMEATAKPSLSAGAICQTAAHVKGGDIVFLESNAVKKDKTLTFSANILSMGAIDLRHGKDIYGASNIVVDSTTVCCYNFTTEPTLTCSFAHGLTVSGETGIVVTVGADSTASVSITSNGKTFTKSGIKWIGTNGSIEMESVDTAMCNLTLGWDCSNYADAVWMFGDSYFTYYEERWPYYIAQKYDDFLLCGFPGAASPAMYHNFQQALTHGTPKIAVWCLGMNDPDADDCINAAWKTYADLFIADCEAKGIVPILATVPNVPERIHCHKNEYVKNSGCRYIDFASAVGANEKGGHWYEGMLSPDQVHPAAAGAQALAKQVLLDLPEIKG